MIDLHNYVNLETGKRYYSYEEVINIYETKYNINLSKNVVSCNEKICNSKTKKNNLDKILYISIGIIIGILLFYIFTLKYNTNKIKKIIKK